MTKYYIKKADIYAQQFQSLFDVDLKSTSRKTEVMTMRTLFYKVLRDLNNMNDRNIQHWFETIGVRRERSSIYHALTKIDLYYTNFDYFRDAYDTFFNDKNDERNNIEEKVQRIVDKENGVVTPKKPKDALEELISGLEGRQREEIYELVQLRIKSWKWKYSDKCEVINCSSSISDFIH